MNTEQLHKEEDLEILEIVRHMIDNDSFENIKYELEESEKHFNYEIITKPSGKSQYNLPNHYEIWIKQSGNAENGYHGSAYMKLRNYKYFKWNYEMI